MMEAIWGGEAGLRISTLALHTHLNGTLIFSPKKLETFKTASGFLAFFEREEYHLNPANVKYL
jgi:hypothetical protein